MKDLQAGDLSRRIEILSAANSVDGSGNRVRTPYATRCTVWGNCYDKASDVQSSTGEITRTIATEITIRYRADIAQSDKVIDHIAGRTYMQTAPPMAIKNRKWLVLYCKEVVRDEA